MKPWNQVTIVGVGLIGGSLGLALKRAGLARRIVGVGHRQVSLDAAREMGAVDATTLDAAEGARGSDLVVLATSVGLFRPLTERLAPALDAGAVVIDVGSIKGPVVAEIEPLLPQGCAFVGCHPIAGSERRGVRHARADLFEGALCVLTPTDRTPEVALRRIEGLWQGVGMTVRTVPPEEHDRLLAEVSHLPHAVAACLVSAIRREAEGFAGPGWRDTTRVAGGDPALWGDILMGNAQALAEALERTEGLLAMLRQALIRGDAEAVERFLAEAKTRRDRAIVAREESAASSSEGDPA